MGSLDPALLQGQRVYLDANILIYFLDGRTEVAALAADILEAAARGDFQAVTSDAAVAEVMVGPYRSGDPMTIRAVREFLHQPRLLDIVPNDSRAFDDAAMLRGVEGRGFIDALHVATAAAAGCTLLVTNDRRIRPALGVEVVELT